MRTRILFAIAAVAAATAAQAAELTLFLQPNFTGRQATLRGESTNLASIGFTDQVSSLVVHSGRWELCTQPSFQGDCVTLGPGEYRTLDKRLNHRIESARLVADERPQVSTYEEPARPYYRERRYSYAPEYERGSIELFAGPGFRGRSMTFESDAAFMAGSGFDNRAASVIVNQGRWQLCTEPRFNGECRVLGPGRYPELGFTLSRDVSSLRQVG